MDQPSAEAYCQDNGGHLAVINSQTELDAAAAVCAASSLTLCWIGLQSEGDSLDWSRTDGSALDFGFNSDGTPTTGINPWYSGEPNSDGEDCIHMWAHFGYQYNDATCSVGMIPLCEISNG